MIEVSAFDTPVEQAILALRLVAFASFLILFGGALSRFESVRAESYSVLRTRIAVAVLFGGFAYVQAASFLVRLFASTGVGIPLTIALTSCIAAVVSVWAFWPWRE